MRLLSLADIQTLELGETIPSFRAQIKEIKKRYTGTNEHGEWSIQSLVVMDPTGICQVKVGNHQEFGQYLVHKYAVFECTKNKRDDSLQGIKWKEDNYKDRKSNVIEVTASGLVLFEEFSPTQPAPEPGPEKKFVGLATQPPDEMHTPSQTAPAQRPAIPDTAQGIQNAKEELGKAANGLIMSYDATLYVVGEVRKKYPDVEFTPEVLERIAVHFNIRLEKSGVLHGLPAGPLPKKKGEVE